MYSANVKCIRGLAGLVVLLSIVPSDAHAMHLADGMLPLSWTIIWWAVALPMLGYGVWRLRGISSSDLSMKPLLGLMTASVFIVSALPVPVPIAGTVSHPCGVGITAILFGPALSAVVSSAALLMQAVFLGHGGFSTLGANLVSMGLVGSVTGYLVFHASQKAGLGFSAGSFLAGLTADWCTYMMTSLQLTLALHGDKPAADFWLSIVGAFLPAQVPIGILEGFVTMGVVHVLKARRPDVLVRLGVMKEPAV